VARQQAEGLPFSSQRPILQIVCGEQVRDNRGRNPRQQERCRDKPCLSREQNERCHYASDQFGGPHKAQEIN
jgi:hypothetical protein